METQVALSPPNRAICGITPLWVQGHALVAAFDRFWPSVEKLPSQFSYEKAAFGRLTRTSRIDASPASTGEGLASVTIGRQRAGGLGGFRVSPGVFGAVFHLCSILALEMHHSGSKSVPNESRELPRPSYKTEHNGTKWNTKIRSVGSSVANRPPTGLPGKRS